MRGVFRILLETQAIKNWFTKDFAFYLRKIIWSYNRLNFQMLVGFPDKFTHNKFVGCKYPEDI